MELVHSGKVRDVYADGRDLVLVASDRVSIYDVVLPTPIPDKGRILTALSLWWLGRLAGVVRELGLGAGLVDNKVCAIDEVWSGLRFVYRLADRPAGRAGG